MSSLPSYPTTSFHTTPEYLSILRGEPVAVPSQKQGSSTSTLRMSHLPSSTQPFHQHVREDDGYPEDEGEDPSFLNNSRIRGLEAFASPEAHHKILPWLDDVPRGGRPDDERSFAGGSTRTGILKPSRKPIPPSLLSSPPPVVPSSATPLSKRINEADAPFPLPSLPYNRRDESESAAAAQLQNELDGTATDVSRAEQEEQDQSRARPASGIVPSPFIPPRDEVFKIPPHRSRPDQLASPSKLHDGTPSRRLRHTSRSPQKPQMGSPDTNDPSSVSSFGNVNNPEKGIHRLTLPVKPAPSAAETHTGSISRRRWDETAGESAPDIPSELSPIPSPPQQNLRERDNDSTRTALPSPHEGQPTESTPSPSRHHHLHHHHSSSQQIVRSNRAPSPSFRRLSTTPNRTPLNRASLFHDPVLCELLEASSSPTAGEEVKSVLRKAVENRVGELARELMRQDARGMELKSGGDQGDEAPPPWAVGLLAKLEENNARMDTILRSLPISGSSSPTRAHLNSSHQVPLRSTNAYIVPLSPSYPTQDIPPAQDPSPSSSRRQNHIPFGTSLGLFTDSPTIYDTPASTLKTFGNPAAEARGMYVSVDASIFKPVGPPEIVVSPSSARPVSSQRALTGMAYSPLPPPLPMAPQILVQAPSTNRSRTPRASSPVVVAEESVLPQAQEVISRDFADRDLPQIPPEVESNSDAGVFAYMPPPVRDDDFEREDEQAQTNSGDSPGRKKEDYGEDPILPRLMDPRPWDLVTQRLYAWTIIWSIEDFIRALEEISLNRQGLSCPFFSSSVGFELTFSVSSRFSVNSFALTIWTTTTYKRQLRHRICSDPRDTIDKLFVPPSMGDSLNSACYHKRFNDAKMIIEELWNPFGLPSLCPTGFPRVILAICRHRNEHDTWAVHRFDLASSSMRTFLFYSGDRKRLADGRPFSWWHAMRAAWPEAGIKDPDNTSDNMMQKLEHIQIPLAEGGDVSLEAVNCFRNLLMGWRWDRPTEIYKLRELVWMEVKRLMNRKAEGRLVLDMAGGGDVSDI